MVSTCIKLVVGLGNPGPTYEAMRHNVGAWFLERLVKAQGQVLRLDAKLSALLATLERPHLFRAMRPTTYMNESGRALSLVAHYFKLTPPEILIVHDELDLPVGTVRLKIKGGHGGHNGLRDILAHFSSADFLRLRIGIGHPGDKDQVSNYVLSPPTKAEYQRIDEGIEGALLSLPKILSGQIAAAMQELHTGGDNGI